MKRALMVVVVTGLVGCGLNDGGLFDPPPEEKREALVACRLAITLPSCVDGSSDEALPAWARFRVSQDALTCIERLDCPSLSEEAARTAQDEAIACLERDRRFDPNAAAPDGTCLAACIDVLDVAVCDNGVDLGTAVDDQEACSERC